MAQPLVLMTTEWSVETMLAWREMLLRERDSVSIATVACRLLANQPPLTFGAIGLCPGETSAEWTVIALDQSQPGVNGATSDLLRGPTILNLGLVETILALSTAGLYQAHAVRSRALGLPETFPSELVALPLHTHRSNQGLLLVAPDDEALSPAILPQLQILAAFLSLALENATLYTRTAQREREIELIAETGKQLTQLQSLSELMPQLVREVSQTFNYDSMGLLLVDEATNEVVVRETIGLERTKHLGFRVPITDQVSGGIVGRVAHQGVAHLSPDVRAETHYIETVANTRSELAVPLKIKDRVIGVLDVQSVTPGGVTQKDLLILTTLADQVAIALENARLYEEIAQAHDELSQKAEELQRLLARTVQIQEDERHRIAADIHDSVIQLVYGALYQVEGATQRLLSDPIGVRTHLQEIRSSLNQAITEMHKAIYDLWPSSLDEMGLLPSVEAFLARFEQSTGIQCSFHTAGSRIRFTPQARITIYRILQEALHNVRKHARATVVEVIFTFNEDAVTVTIRDDGRGFKREEVGASSTGRLGLIAMRERVQTIGGAFDIQSGRSGTLITLTLPRDQIERDGDGGQ